MPTVAPVDKLVPLTAVYINVLEGMAGAGAVADVVHWAIVSDAAFIYR